MFSILNHASSWAITSSGNKFCLKKRSKLMKALDNRFYVKFMQLEIGLLVCLKVSFTVQMIQMILIIKSKCWNAWTQPEQNSDQVHGSSSESMWMFVTFLSVLSLVCHPNWKYLPQAEAMKWRSRITDDNEIPYPGPITRSWTYYQIRGLCRYAEPRQSRWKFLWNF